MDLSIWCELTAEQIEDAITGQRPLALWLALYGRGVPEIGQLTRLQLREIRVHTFFRDAVLALARQHKRAA